jgi:hypothetical protein
VDLLEKDSFTTGANVLRGKWRIRRPDSTLQQPGPTSIRRDGSISLKWRAPSERIRTAFEIPFEVDLTDEDAIPIYMKISEKVLHLRRLGISFASIAERLGVNLWMAKRAARWGNRH